VVVGAIIEPTPMGEVGAVAYFSAKQAAKEGGKKLATRFIAGKNGAIHDVQPTLNRIASGGKHPHVRDGSTFFNREGLLPNKPSGYYKEYVHPTPGAKGAGQMRVVTGKKGEAWFTPDHYKNFTPIR
jgi:guanyl-specific ribonuclease Sa